MVPATMIDEGQSGLWKPDGGKEQQESTKAAQLAHRMVIYMPAEASGATKNISRDSCVIGEHVRF